MLSTRTKTIALAFIMSSVVVGSMKLTNNDHKLKSAQEKGITHQMPPLPVAVADDLSVAPESPHVLSDNEQPIKSSYASNNDSLERAQEDSLQHQSDQSNLKVNLIAQQFDVLLPKSGEEHHALIDLLTDRIRTSAENLDWRNHVETLIDPALKRFDRDAYETQEVVLECGQHICAVQGISNVDAGERVMATLLPNQSFDNQGLDIATSVGWVTDKYGYTIFIVSTDFDMKVADNQ